MPDVEAVPAEISFSGLSAFGEAVACEAALSETSGVADGISFSTQRCDAIFSVNPSTNFVTGCGMYSWGNISWANTDFAMCEPATVSLSGRGYWCDSPIGGSGLVVLQGDPTVMGGLFSTPPATAVIQLITSTDTPYCNPIWIYPDFYDPVTIDVYPGVRVISKIRNPTIILAGGLMSASTYIYNKFLELVGENAVDFEWHELYGALMSVNYNPDIDDDEYWDDVSMFELSENEVYSSQGKPLVDPVFVRNDTTDSLSITWNPIRWNVPLGYSLRGMKGILLYDKSIPRWPLIAFMEFASPMDVPELNSFVVTPQLRILNSGS